MIVEITQRVRRTVRLALVVTLAVPGTAVRAIGQHQDSPRSTHVATSMVGTLPQLTPTDGVGQHVFVIDRQGVETQGTLLKLADASAELLLPGGRSKAIPFADIARIDVITRSLKKGAIIGAILGAGFGGLGLLTQETSRAGAMVGGAVSVALIGTAIAALNPRRRTIYRAPAP